MKKRFGFTLAEVLITLGIIGVVAAMTIPTLLQNTNSVKFATQFKKSLSTVKQAGLMAVAQYDMEYGLASDKCTALTDSLNANRTETTGSTPTLTVTNKSICAILNSTLSGHTAYGTGDITNSNGGKYTFASSDLINIKARENYYIFALSDGSFVGVNKDAKNCTLGDSSLEDAMKAGTGAGGTGAGALNACIGFIDVNGAGLPNKEVRCTDNTAALVGSTQYKSGTGESATTKTCMVSKTGMGDLFPIVFHDDTVEPATAAVRAVLAQGK